MLVHKSHLRMLLAVLALVFTFNAVEAASPPINLKGVKVVDLTYSFDDKTIYWPNAPTTFQLNRLSYGKTEAGYFYASNSFCTPEHGGTPTRFRSSSSSLRPWWWTSAPRRRPIPITV
jgi:hypothetical protein